MAKTVVTPVVQPCPPGMEYLVPTSGIFIRQQVELCRQEVLMSYHTNNKFEILDDHDGRRLYLAAEQKQTSCCVRFWLGSHRPFSILVLNPTGAICLRMKRPCGFWCLMGYCCNDVEVFTGLDVLVGKVFQPMHMHSCCCTEFVISDAVGKKCLKVHGPCHICICCEADFPILDTSGDEIGVIHKQWGGTQCCTSATNFEVVYPANLDPTMKCLLIAAAFLIDFMYYEWKKENYH